MDFLDFLISLYISYFPFFFFAMLSIDPESRRLLRLLISVWRIRFEAKRNKETSLVGWKGCNAHGTLGRSRRPTSLSLSLSLTLSQVKVLCNRNAFNSIASLNVNYNIMTVLWVAMNNYHLINCDKPQGAFFTTTISGVRSSTGRRGEEGYVHVPVRCRRS